MSSFDDIIQQKLAGHESPVPVDAWKKIMPRKKKRRFVFWYWMMAALLVAGVGIPAFRHWQPGQQVSGSAKVTKEKLAKVDNHAAIKTAAQPAADVAADHAPATLPAEASVSAETSLVAADVATGEESAGVEKQVPGSPIKKRSGGKLLRSITVAAISEATVAIDHPRKGDRAAAKSLQQKGTLAVQTGNADLASLEEEKINEEGSKQPMATTSQQAATKTDKDVVSNKPVQTDEAISATAKPSDSAAMAQTAVAKSSVGKKQGNGLYAELSVTPFFPASHVTGGTSFVRSDVSNGVRTVFTANQFHRQLGTAIGFQVAIRKAFGRRWQIGTGLQVALLKELVQVKGEEVNTRYQLVDRLVQANNMPVLVQDSVQQISKGLRQIEALNSYRFLSVPVFVQYQAGKWSGFDIAITGGAYFNLNNHYYNSIERLVNTSAKSNIDNIGMDLFGGMRVSTLVAHKLNVFVEPTVRFNLASSYVKNALVNGPVRQLSVAAGIALKLK